MSEKVTFPLEKLQEIAPDLVSVRVATDYPGVNGWAVFLRYADDKQAAFTVDKGGSDDSDMLKLTESAIRKQLEYHNKTKESPHV